VPLESVPSSVGEFTPAHPAPLVNDEQDVPPEVQIRILVVDPHPLLRLGISRLLAQTRDLSVVAETSNAAAALELFETILPDLVILEIDLPGRSGFDLLKDLRLRKPGVRVLIHSHLDETLFGLRAQRLGAAGYLSKNAPPESLVQALRNIRVGTRAFTSPKSTPNVAKPPDSPLDTLSDREFEVFRLIGHGLPSAEIADQLHISCKTVDAHRERLKRKLGLHSASQLNLLAIRWVCTGS